VRRRDFVVDPAIPILFFGNSNRYFKSPLRVITVGKNPSNEEFPKDDPFSRFPEMRDNDANTPDQKKVNLANELRLFKNNLASLACALGLENV
jgi:hypothetical protein